MHAESSTRSSRILTVFILILALAGCGQGDGPARIAGTAATPLPDPAFCDPITFEGVCDLPAIEFFGGGVTVLVDSVDNVTNPENEVNLPDPTGINPSDTYARMQKFGEAPFGGTRITPLRTPVDFSAGEAYKMKVWSERPVPVTFKLEETNDGTLGVAKVATHNGGSAWEELCFDFTNETVTTIGLTIIFDNGVLGEAQAGVFQGDWTFYYDDITLVESCGNSGPAAGIVPDVKLYDPAGNPDLVIPDDYAEVTEFGSQSVINPDYADDASYSPVLAVSSGVGYGANVAQVGYIGFDAGFASGYASLDFKVKGMPNSVIFVKLYDSVDSLRINLSSSAYAAVLDDGWYQVSIPLASFNGLSLATGLVFESDNTAPMQFTFFLTDVGFSTTGGGGGGTSLGVFSETNTDPVVNITGIVSAGNPVGIDTASTAVTPFDGTVSLELMYSDNTAGQGFGGAIFEFDDADLSTYDTLKFAIDTSAFTNFANLTVQLEPPGGGTPGGNVSLAAYTPVATTGNWNTYEIPLADFTAVNPSAVNRLGFFNARDGGDVLLAGTLYLDDIHFTRAGGGGGGSTSLGVFSETNTDPVVTITDILSVGNPVGIDTASTAVTPFDGTVSLELMFSDNTAGQGFGGAVVTFNDEDLSTYNTLKFAIDTSAFTSFANLTVQLEPPGGGTPGGNVALAAYTPVATTGNWNTYEIPLADFTAVNPSVVNALGFFNARDGGDVLLAGTLYLDDIHFTTVGGSGGGGAAGELAVNGGFETGGFDDWQQFVNSGVQSISTDTPANGGSFSAALSANTAVGAGGTTEIKQANLGSGGGVALGDVLTIQFDVKGTFGPAGQLNVLSFTEFGGGGGDLSNNTTIAGGVDNWTHYEYDVTLSGPDASGGFSLAFNPVCGAVAGCFADVLIDNVSIVIN